MASKRDPRNHHTNGSVDSLSVYAKACARQSGQQLRVLGEAGFKYLSSAVENWRAGASDNGGMMTSPRGGLILLLFHPVHHWSFVTAVCFAARHSLAPMHICTA